METMEWIKKKKKKEKEATVLLYTYKRIIAFAIFWTMMRDEMWVVFGDFYFAWWSVGL